MEARGAYIDLLVMMYEHGGPVPYDLDELRGHFGLPSIRVLRRLIDELLAKKKIAIQDGCLVNERAMLEIETAHRAIEKAAEYGRMGGRPRKSVEPETKAELQECLAEVSAKDSGNIAETFEKLEDDIEENQALSKTLPSPSPSPSKEEEREKQVSLSLSVCSAKAEATASVTAKGVSHASPDSMAEPTLPLDGGTATAPKPARRPRRTPLNGSPEIDTAFDRFWLAYPCRDTSDNRSPAKKAFIAEVRSGTNAEILVHAAERYAEEAKSRRIADTKYIRKACNWLKEGDWEKYKADNVHSGSFREGKPEPEWKTNPKAWIYDYAPPWPDAPKDTRCGRWVKGSYQWVRAL